MAAKDALSKQQSRELWVNQTELCAMFGLSAVAVGKKLQELGLHGTDKAPTEAAIRQHMVRSTPMADGRPCFMWLRERAAAVLRSSGLTERAAHDRAADRYKQIAQRKIAMN